MERKYVLIGKMSVHASKIKDFVAIIEQVDISKMNGCFSYDISWDSSSVVVHEVWESEEHHDQALKDPHVLSLITQAMPLLDGTPTVLFEGETYLS